MASFGRAAAATARNSACLGRPSFENAHAVCETPCATSTKQARITSRVCIIRPASAKYTGLQVRLEVRGVNARLRCELAESARCRGGGRIEQAAMASLEGGVRPYEVRQLLRSARKLRARRGRIVPARISPALSSRRRARQQRRRAPRAARHPPRVRRGRPRAPTRHWRVRIRRASAHARARRT